MGSGATAGSKRMKSIYARGLLLPALVSLAACQPTPPPVSEVRVEDAWARSSRGASMTTEGSDSRAVTATSAVYMVLHNEGGRGDTLLAARTDAARAVEIHESRMDGGVMRMRRADRVEIPAGEAVRLKPGGLHLMLVGLTRELAVGDELRVEIDLADAGSRTIIVPVREP